MAMGKEWLAQNILSTDQSTIDLTKAPVGHTEVGLDFPDLQGYPCLQRKITHSFECVVNYQILNASFAPKVLENIYE